MGENVRRKLEQITLDQALERFQVYNRAANKSSKTLEWYAVAISRYRQYLTQTLEREPRLADIDLLSVRGFVVHLQDKDGKALSDQTINSYVRSLRAFTHFLYEDGLTRTWLLEKMKAPKVELKLKDIVEPETIKRMFAAFNGRTFLGSRNIAMIALFLDGGLRLSELAQLPQFQGERSFS